MNETQLADLEHENFIAALALVAEVVPAGFVERHGGVLAAVSGSPIALFNPILIEAPEATPADLEAALAAVTATGHRFSAYLRVGTDDRLRPVLEASALEPGEGAPGMVMTPIVDYDMPSDLEIRSGTSPDVIAGHTDVVAAAFDMSREIIETFMVPELFVHESLTFYAGFVDGECVTASFGQHRGPALTVFNVATLEGYRGRGYGTAMTMRAAIDGRDAGCEVAVLQSSPMGYPVYDRLGFRTVVEYEEWVSPRPQDPPSAS